MFVKILPRAGLKPGTARPTGQHLTYRVTGNTDPLGPQPKKKG